MVSLTINTSRTKTKKVHRTNKQALQDRRMRNLKYGLLTFCVMAAVCFFVKDVQAESYMIIWLCGAGALLAVCHYSMKLIDKRYKDTGRTGKPDYHVFLYIDEKFTWLKKRALPTFVTALIVVLVSIIGFSQPVS